MALASQSISTGDRRRITYSQRRLLSPRLIGTVAVAGAVVLGSWWLLSGGNDDGADPTSGSLAGVTPADSELEPLPGGGTSEGSSGPSAPRTEPSRAAAPERPSLRALVAEDRASGTVGNGVGSTIEMGSRSGAQAPTTPPATTPPASTPAGAQPPTSPAANPAANPATNPATSPANVPPAPQGTPQPGHQPTQPPAQPTTITPPAAPPGGSGGVPTGVANTDLAKAFQLQSTDPVSARVLVTRALDGGTLSPSDRERAYELVNGLGKALFLNTNINPNDPMMRVHAIQPGESLAKIVRNQGLACETLLLKRINGIKDERRLQIGQKLRVPKGAFHAEVVKAEYRFNLYLDAGEGSTERVMVASLRCGLGESGGTPTGLFRVRPKSKLIDPEWTHPKTGEHYMSNDPKNPIGEHWIGIMGVEPGNKDLLGYGIHGTVDPDSIGKDRSLGCVRMLADDIAFVYECLVDPQSTIRIR